MKEMAWKKVVGCAAMQEGTAPEQLVSYIMNRVACDEAEAEKQTEACRAEAEKEQAEAKLRYPVAAAGIFVGILAAVMNGVMFLSTGCNPLFLMFLLISLSLIKGGEKYVAHRNAVKKAETIWKERLAQQQQGDATALLEEMEKVFTK